jgi:hypothetical protein
MLEGWDNDYRIHHDFWSMNPLTDLLVQFFRVGHHFGNVCSHTGRTHGLSGCSVTILVPIRTTWNQFQTCAYTVSLDWSCFIVRFNAVMGHPVLRARFLLSFNLWAQTHSAYGVTSKEKEKANRTTQTGYSIRASEKQT